MTIKPLGLYVHVPFCAGKCAYCDFYSRPGQAGLHKAFVDAVLKEGDLKGLGRSLQPTTLYLGGGTPTALSLEAMAALLAGLDQRIGLTTLAEITVEANPKGLSQDMVALLQAYGVHRVSLGVQSFSASFLKVLGRDQAPEEPAQAVTRLRKGGIPRINLDLIYALPGQSLEDWKKDVRQAVNLGPDHLSLYQLSISPQSPLGRAFAQGELAPIPEDLAADAWDWHTAYLESQGFGHYEVSNYAKPGKESLHNQIYWRLDDYLALGPSATQWLRPHRRTNAPDLAGYLAALDQGSLPPGGEEVVSLRDQEIEAVIMGLRLSQGVSKGAFEARFGRPLADAFPGVLEKLEAKGLVLEGSGHVRLSPRGMALGNLVFMAFL